MIIPTVTTTTTTTATTIISIIITIITRITIITIITVKQTRPSGTQQLGDAAILAAVVLRGLPLLVVAEDIFPNTVIINFNFQISSITMPLLVVAEEILPNTKTEK